MTNEQYQALLEQLNQINVTLAKQHVQLEHLDESISSLNNRFKPIEENTILMQGALKTLAAIGAGLGLLFSFLKLF